MLSVFGFVAFIVHASIFCLRFSQKQSANQPKKIQGNGLLLNIKAHAKIQALLKEKKFYPKKSLTSLLHQAIQLFVLASLSPISPQFPESSQTCLANMLLMSPTWRLKWKSWRSVAILETPGLKCGNTLVFIK